MLAGPPRLAQAILLIIALTLTWYYLHITASSPYSPASLLPHKGSKTSPSKSGMPTTNIDFGIPIRFKDGREKEGGANYSSIVVVPKTKEEDLSWLEREVPGLPVMVYEVDRKEGDEKSPEAEPYGVREGGMMTKGKIPQNKGREAMVYLTYLIDHYDKLPDIIIFMHAHQRAWHNNQLQGLDTAQMLRKLNSARVARQGYMNLRCHHNPGCPDWIHMDRPGIDFDFFHKPEEPYIRRPVWESLLPGAPVPPALSATCCAQFAVSAERVRQVPKERFIWFRTWLMNTDMDDQWSGRVFEYLWHWIFTGWTTYCPAENSCYCDGYGYCFGGAKKYKEFMDMQDERNKFNEELSGFRDKEEEKRKEGKEMVWSTKEKERKEWLIREIGRMDVEMDKRRQEALKRGEDPEARRAETENWESGDGLNEYLPGGAKVPG